MILQFLAGQVFSQRLVQTFQVNWNSACIGDPSVRGNCGVLWWFWEAPESGHMRMVPPMTRIPALLAIDHTSGDDIQGDTSIPLIGSDPAYVGIGTKGMFWNQPSSDPIGNVMIEGH